MINQFTEQEMREALELTGKYDVYLSNVDTPFDSLTNEEYSTKLIAVKKGSCCGFKNFLTLVEYNDLRLENVFYREFKSRLIKKLFSCE